MRLTVVVKSGPHKGLTQEFPYDAGAASPHFSRAAALKRAGDWIETLKATGDRVTVTEGEVSLLSLVFPEGAAWESVGEGLAAWCFGNRVWSI